MARGGAPGFEPRRYVLLCLACAVLERAEVQITLGRQALLRHGTRRAAAGATRASLEPESSALAAYEVDVNVGALPGGQLARLDHRLQSAAELTDQATRR